MKKLVLFIFIFFCLYWSFDVAKGEVQLVTSDKYFVYILNASSKNISIFSMNPSNGALTEINGSPFSLPNPSNDGMLTAAPNGKYIYMPSMSSISTNKLTAFQINQVTGALSEVTGSPYDTGLGPKLPAIDPQGKFLYIPNFNANTLSAFQINSTTGVLSSIDTYSITNETYPAFNAYPCSAVVDPTGKFLYILKYWDQHIIVYNINSTTGALTEVTVGTFDSLDWLDNVTIHPTGNYLYAVHCNTTFGVAAYQINTDSQQLSYINVYTTGSTGTNYPWGIVIDPTGKFLYVNDFFDNDFCGFTINPNTGELTAMNGSPFSFGNKPTVGIDPTGKFLFMTDGVANTVSVYNINSTTGIPTTTGLSYSTGQSPSVPVFIKISN